MALLTAFALALALQAEAPAQPAVAPSPAADAPMQATPQSAAAAAEQPLPLGAPEDDYGFVNWCWGALNGHMALYPRVQSQLDADGYEADQQMLAAGREYLTLYERAINAADQASSTSRASDAAAGRRAGANVWAGNERADATTLKWAFLGWSLPGRCETAARRLLEQSELMAPALRGGAPARTTTPADATNAHSQGAETPTDAAPAPTAQ